MTSESELFLRTLIGDAPTGNQSDSVMTFGRFVGIWDMAVEYFNAEGRRIYEGRWEWAFGWVLGGQAIQDVITVLDPDAPPGHKPPTPTGTTLRYWNPATELWTIYFLSVRTGVTTMLHGGAEGTDIILRGSDPDGTRNIWTFSDITGNSFTWTGLESSDGNHWWRNQHMRGTRRT